MCIQSHTLHIQPPMIAVNVHNSNQTQVSMTDATNDWLCIKKFRIIIVKYVQEFMECIYFWSSTFKFISSILSCSRLITFQISVVVLYFKIDSLFCLSLLKAIFTQNRWQLFYLLCNYSFLDNHLMPIFQTDPAKDLYFMTNNKLYNTNLQTN